MKLTSTGRPLQPGETRPIGDTGLQIRKLPNDGGVVQEIANLRQWRKFAAAQNKHLFTKRERDAGARIPEPPLSPQVRAKQLRASQHLTTYQKGNTP